MMPRSTFTFAALTALLALTPAVAHAQVFVAPPYQQPPYQQPPYQQSPYQQSPNGYPNPYGYPQNNVPNSQQPYGRQTPAQALTGPPGVGKMYGIEANNSILVYGTQKGYDLVRQLIRNLDGDSDIDHATIALIRETPDYLKSLGVTVGTDGALTEADAQKLLDASQAGKLTSCAALKITSGDGEEVDTTLNKGGAILPFAVTTTVDSISKTTVSFTAPVTASLSLRPGQIGIIAIPPAASDTHPIVSLLFVTAGIVKRG